MALREKFGRLVLLDETDAGALGREYRAARLGPAGLDRVVTVFRFGPEVSSHAEATRRLMEQARLAARLQSPGLVRVLGIGRVEHSFYVSTELVEGRSVAAILDHCRVDAFPFAAEHALMIASRAASTLESLHEKKDDAGAALVHGLVAPSRLVVAFDGEVKLKGLGLWPALRGTDLLPVEERRYLAPEQLAGGAGETRSDVYALGLVLLEALTGRAPDGSDPLDGLGAAKITTTTGEAAPLPKPLGELLRHALAREPAARFPEMSGLRRAIDALVFSGDFAPTTFDLAFFMHTLFREDMERETRALEEARRGDYREFLAGEKPAAPVPTAAEPDAGAAAERAPEGAPVRAPAPPLAQPRPAEPTAEVPAPTSADSSHPPAAGRPSAPAPGPDVSSPRVAAARAREAAARMTLGGAAAPAPARRRGLWILLGLVGVVGLGGAGWMYFARLRGPSPSLSAEEAAAAQARVRELETRIAQLEHEKAEAEAKAAEEARSKLEAQAAAGGKAVDRAAMERAQQEARQRARAEQERKQQEELGRLAAERAAEVQRLAVEATPLPTPPPTPVPTATPTPLPTATPTPLPAALPASTPAFSQEPAAAPAGAVPSGGTSAGPAPATPAATPGRAIADPSDPAVKPPVLQSENPVPYPPLAVGLRISASVTVRALVDERGRVTEATVIRSSGQPVVYGFDEAALRRVRSRRYRPARRNDAAVPIWVIVRVEFRPPPR